jgi:hypothetical protein
MTPEQQKTIAIARARARTKAKANVAPEGEVGLLTPADDVIRIMADSLSRGGLDKLRGPEEQAHTLRSRERTPGFIEAGADITGGLLGSPYRVGSALYGGVAGGLEGAASAYGHQKGWVPDLQGAKDILYEGGKGALLGSGAAKGAEWLGKGFNWLKGKPPYSTADELADAAAQADRRTKAGRDTVARDARMKAAEIAQAEGPGGFQKMVEGMDRPVTLQEKTFPQDYPPRIDWPHKEKVAATKLANPTAEGNFVQRALQTAGSMAEGGGGWGKLWTGPLNIAAPLLKSMGAVKDVSADEWQNMQRLILDSTGRLKTDKATVDLLRNYLSKTAVQGGKGERVPKPW